MAEITTTTSENKTMSTMVLVDGKAAYSLTGNVNGGRAGGFSISGNPQNMESYQENKDEIEPVIQDFCNEVLVQAKAQENADKVMTSEDEENVTVKEKEVDEDKAEDESAEEETAEEETSSKKASK